MISKIQELTGQVDKKRLYTAGATLVVALATGYVMQRGDSPAAPQVAAAQMGGSAQVSAPVAPAAKPAAEASVQPAALETASDDVAVEAGLNKTDPDAVIAALETPAPAKPAQAESAPLETAEAAPAEVAPEPAPVEEVTRTETDVAAPLSPVADRLDAGEPAGLADATNPASNAACAPSMSGIPTKGAMILLSFNAPCNAGEDVLFNHAGLRFSEELDPDGNLSIMVPALMSEAAVSAELEDGARIETFVEVPEAAEFDRVALVWEGGTGLQLHALENGASYGDDGHVSAENPRMPSGATGRQGGFLTVLGSSKAGFAADVYSYPSRSMSEPDVSIEAQVLETTCGSEIKGEYLRSQKTAPPVQTDIGMMVPACETVGDYLVLKNLPQELKIARN